MSRAITWHVAFPIDGLGEITPCTEKNTSKDSSKKTRRLSSTVLDSRRRHCDKCKNEGLSMIAIVQEISGL